MNEASSGQFRMGWGLAALGLLVGIYGMAILQIPPPDDTGVRVIPWQAPDLEISDSIREIPAP